MTDTLLEDRMRDLAEVLTADQLKWFMRGVEFAMKTMNQSNDQVLAAMQSVVQKPRI